MLREGNLETATKLLGHSYSVVGDVVPGAGLGKSLGFPTINLKVHPYKILPSNGVYAVEVYLKNLRYIGAANIGVAPTIQKRSKPVLEIHLLNFDHREIHGEKVEVKFVQRIRPEIKFQSIEELRSQINEDIRKVKRILGSTG